VTKPKLIPGFDKNHPQLAAIPKGGVKVKPAFVPSGSTFEDMKICEGDLITYAEYTYPVGKEGDIQYQQDHRRLARVMCLAITGGDGKELDQPTFCCLAADDGMTFGYIRFVEGKDIQYAQSGTGAFAKWFVFGDFNAEQTPKIWYIEHNGSLCNRYIVDYLAEDMNLKYNRDMLAWPSMFLDRDGIKISQALFDFEEHLLDHGYNPDWYVTSKKAAPDELSCHSCGGGIGLMAYVVQTHKGAGETYWHMSCMKDKLAWKPATDLLPSFYKKTLIHKHEIPLVESHAQRIGGVVKCSYCSRGLRLDPSRLPS